MCQHQQPKRSHATSQNQHTMRQNLGHAVFERFEFIRSLSENAPWFHFSLSPKSIAHELIIQQQRHMRSIKHDTLVSICIDDVRRHIMSPAVLAVAVKTPARYRTYGISAEKGMNTSNDDRCAGSD